MPSGCRLQVSAFYTFLYQDTPSRAGINGFALDVARRATARNLYCWPSNCLVTQRPVGVSSVLIPTRARWFPKALIICLAKDNWPPTGKLSKSHGSIKSTPGIVKWFPVRGLACPESQGGVSQSKTWIIKSACSKRNKKQYNDSRECALKQ